MAPISRLPTRPSGHAVLKGDDRKINQLPKAKVPLGYFTMEEVSKHSTLDDGWVVVDGKVFNITNFAKFHPGWSNGAQTSTVIAIKRVLGTDCSTEFHTIHNLDSTAMLVDYYIGDVISTPDKRPSDPPTIDGSWMERVLSRALDQKKRAKGQSDYMQYMQEKLRAQHKARRRPTRAIRAPQNSGTRTLQPRHQTHLHSRPHPSENLNLPSIHRIKGRFHHPSRTLERDDLSDSNRSEWIARVVLGTAAAVVALAGWSQVLASFL